MKSNLPLKVVSAKNFYDKETGRYRFPFMVLDDTPGGSNLGRIEWCIEFVKSKKKRGRYYIEKILVSAKQTRDERYEGKIFEIPTFTESVTAQRHSSNNYFAHVWRILYCEIHKDIFFDAYPKNEHSALIIECNSSISNEIYFE